MYTLAVPQECNWFQSGGGNRVDGEGERDMGWTGRVDGVDRLDWMR